MVALQCSHDLFICKHAYHDQFHTNPTPLQGMSSVRRKNSCWQTLYKIFIYYSMAQPSVYFFSLLDRLLSHLGWVMWLRTFIWELVHKEKDAGAALETKSQPEQKLFYHLHQKWVPVYPSSPFKGDRRGSERKEDAREQAAFRRVENWKLRIGTPLPPLGGIYWGELGCSVFSLVSPRITPDTSCIIVFRILDSRP